MAKVYFYKLPSPDTGEMVMPPLKATAETVEQCGGVLLSESEEEVADEQVDAKGHYDPAAGDAADDAIGDQHVSEKPPIKRGL